MSAMMDRMEQALTVEKGPARYTRFAVLGLLLIASAPLLMLVAGMVFGLEMGEDFGFFLAVLAIPLVAALLVRAFGWWAKVLGILAVLVTLGGTFWLAFGLQQPASFFDFVPGALLGLGAVSAIVGCIAAIFAGRRGHRGPETTGGERTATRTVLLLTAIVVLVSGALTFTGMSEATGAADSETLSSKDFQFTPRDVEVEAGSILLVRNDDPFFHTFTVDELGIDESFTLGDQIGVRIPDKPGTYVFYCRPHTGNPKNPSSDDMAGTITIS